ncbi:MAG: DMT family transporter [Eubacteriales bacterium]|nr:DMT family transporter [Eubacteriales bacterium]
MRLLSKLPGPIIFNARLFILLAALLWGYSYIANRQALDAGLSASAIMALRFLIAAVGLKLACPRKLQAFNRVEIRSGMLCAAFFYGGFLLQTKGIARSSPALAALICASAVLLTPFFAALLFKKRIKARIYIAAVLCFFGIGILSMDFSHGLEFHFGLGELLLFIAAILFSFHTLVNGYYATQIRPLRLTYLQLFFASLYGLLDFLCEERSLMLIPSRPEQIAPLLYLGIAGSLLAFYLKSQGLREVEASEAAILMSSESLFATLFSLLLGFDVFRLPLLIGTLLIFTALLLANLNLKKLHRS